MEKIDFDFVIDKVLSVKDESVKAGVLCELAKGLIHSKDDQDTVVKRLYQIIELADTFKDEKYSSIVIGQIALVSANIMGIPCDSDLYAEIIEDNEAEKAFIERIKEIKEELNCNGGICIPDIRELEK